jgi:hypothetical protein
MLIWLNALKALVYISMCDIDPMDFDLLPSWIHFLCFIDDNFLCYFSVHLDSPILYNPLFFFLSLYLEGSPPVEDPWGAMRWGRSPYISPFPWKDFLMRRIRKIEKHKEERDRSGKFKKARWRKEKKRFLHSWRFSYSCVLHRLGTPLGYCARATLPQDNPLIWEPPLQF